MHAVPSLALFSLLCGEVKKVSVRFKICLGLLLRVEWKWEYEAVSERHARLPASATAQRARASEEFYASGLRARRWNLHPHSFICAIELKAMDYSFMQILSDCLRPWRTPGMVDLLRVRECGCSLCVFNSQDLLSLLLGFAKCAFLKTAFCRL